jgi:hypothetical protein
LGDEACADAPLKNAPHDFEYAFGTSFEKLALEYPPQRVRNGSLVLDPACAKCNEVKNSPRERRIFVKIVQSSLYFRPSEIYY